MAAAEYYMPGAGRQDVAYQNPYPPQPHSQHQYQQPPPAYSAYPQEPSPQQAPQLNYPSQSDYQQYPQNGSSMAPYPETMKPLNFPPPPQQHAQPGYLSAPFRPHRSHSQPSRPQRVRFEDDLNNSDFSDERSYPSDSDYSSRQRRHRHRKHHRSHSYDRSRSRSFSPARDRGHDRSRHHESKSHRKDKDRNTFLGAGVGGLIGDAIVPGLGTAAGLLLGGYGGRQHTKRRSRSDAADRRYSHRGRAGGEDGWDKNSATFRKGHAVR